MTAARYDSRCPLVVERDYRTRECVVRRIYWRKRGTVNTATVWMVRRAMGEAAMRLNGIPPMRDGIKVELTACQFSRLLADPDPAIREYVTMHFAPRLKLRQGHWGKAKLRVRLDELATQTEQEMRSQDWDSTRDDIMRRLRALRDGVPHTRKGSLEALGARLTQDLEWEAKDTLLILPRILALLTRNERQTLRLDAGDTLNEALASLEAALGDRVTGSHERSQWIQPPCIANDPHALRHQEGEA